MVNDRIIRPKELRQIVGLSTTTLWRLERRKEFPARRRLSAGSVGWLESEVMQWVQERQTV